MMKDNLINQKNLRLYKRYRCRYLALIYYRNELLDYVFVNNISTEGLQLKIDKHNLKPGCVIDIILQSSTENKTISTPAYVVHCQPNKIGVWINDEDKKLNDFIQSMINELVPNNFLYFKY